jgi:small nuclear ribonucleoprotein E
MNLVIDDAVEVKLVTKTNPEEKRRSLGADNHATSRIIKQPANHATGQILLKGDNVALIQEAV